MKKIFAFLLVAAMLVSMFAVTSMAATYSYTITGVDIEVQDANIVVCTSLDKWATCNPGWSMNLQCTPDGDNYKVVATSNCPQQDVDKGNFSDLTEASGFSAQDGDIYVILHAGDANVNPDVWSIGNGMTVEISDMAEGGTITFSGTASGGSSSSSDKDYDRIRVSNNVASGKSYETSLLYRQGGPEDNWAYNENANIAYPDDGGELTNGKVPNDGAYSNPNWVGLHTGTPDVSTAEGGPGYAWAIIDLEEVTDITECIAYVPANEKTLSESGISDPYFVQFSGSNDGETWEHLGHLEEADIDAMNQNFSDYIIAASVKCEASVRYVRAEITNGGWAFLSEVAVIGADTGSEDKDEDNNQEEQTPVAPVDPTIDFDLGAENADAVFNAVIDAPETYVAGEEVTVTVSIKDIKVETGLHAVKVNFYYDNNKLELTGLTEGSSSVPAFADYAEWEDMSRYVTGDDGVTMIEVAAATAGDKDGNFTVAKNDGELVFNIKFVAKADATGDIAVWAPHATVTGSYVGETAAVDYVGNGSSDIIKGVVEPTDDEPTGDNATPNKPGDATSMIVFAIIALVAIAGSAVVIKTRR